MENLRIILEVARWEFLRFFKIKDILTTLGIFLAMAAAYAGIKQLANSSGDEYSVAVVQQADRLELQLAPGSSIELQEASPEQAAELRDAVGSGDLDGLLIIQGRDAAELIVKKRPPWRDELQDALTAARRTSEIRSIGLTSAQLEQVMSPFEFDVRFHEAADDPVSSDDVIAAGTLIGLMLLGILIGNAYLFTAITGEKTQRVSESIISAIPIQTWVDGKILGQSFMAFTSILSIVISYLLSNGALGLMGERFQIPFSFGDPAKLAVFALLGLLGFFLWFSFFAAIAATIDDPNSSSRSAFLLLPVLPLAAAFSALDNPDALLIRILGIFPLTSPTFLPARIALGSVSYFDVAAAVALLIATIWFFRRTAGRMFELSILMYGKEPGWAEMMRQLRS